MYKFCLHIILLLCFTTSFAQPINLVPNGSFEDTVKYNNGLFFVKDWDMNLGTPDYFHSAYQGLINSRVTPLNYYGYQYPKEGKAYVGFSVKNLDLPEAREYIQIKLNEILARDSLYDVNFWVNLPDSFHLACSNKNIGFAFSDTLVKSNFENLNRLSPIYLPETIWETTNKIGWEKIHIRIKATGNEKYIIIGNFLPDSLTKLINIGGGEKNVYKVISYYFIDNIHISLHEELDTISPPDTTGQLIIPNVFTPNGDGINDNWELKNDDKVKEIILFNRWGNIVKEWKTPKGYWDGNGAEEGVYFYKIFLEKETKTGSFLLLR